MTVPSFGQLNRIRRRFWSVFLLVLAGCSGLVSPGYVETNSGPVRAGEDASLDVVLDKAPNFEGGEIQVSVVGPQNSNATLTAKVKTHPGTRVYHVSVPVPASAPGGTWTVAKVIFLTGTQEIPLSSNNQPIQVLANPNIVLPTSAQVTVTLSQAQLPRSEATQLQFRLQVLKASLTLSGANPAAVGSVAETLSKKINEELVFLATTETKFHALASSQPQLDAAASVFFGDLRLSYEEAKSQLKDRSARLERGGSFKLASLASKQGPTEQPRYPVLAQAVFRVFEQNELAYVTVASVGTLTFDFVLAP